MSDGTAEILDTLYETIEARRGGDPEASYTAKLFDRGRRKIAEKFGEEAIELVVATLAEGPDQMVRESADVLYHMLVLWADRGIKPAEVWNELASRQSQSGLDEKKSRKKGG
jgi:phosphoribosyl-ATP pyrophosphohydrolase